MKHEPTADIVDAVLDQVEFTAPIEMEDVQAVHDAIRANLPAKARLESYHRHRDVIFEVRMGNEVVCRRVKKVVSE